MRETEIAITLVGTSILRNFVRNKSHPCLNANNLRQVETSRTCDCSCVRDLLSELYNFVRSQPQAASAELNALLSYIEHLKERDLLPNEFNFKLLVSDTCAGSIAGLVLKEFLLNDFQEVAGINVNVRAEVLKVRDLGVNFYKGLLNLFCYVSYILNCYRDTSDEKVTFSANLTGGFKPEGAYVLIPLSANALKVKAVYYIHENFRDLVILPILPTTINLKQANCLTHAGALSGIVTGEYAQMLINCATAGKVCGLGIRNVVSEVEEIC